MRLVIIGLLPALTAVTLNAQTALPFDIEGGSPAVHATPRSGRITLDGELTEEVWRKAPPVSGFVQRDPVEGATAEEQTQVRVLFDDDALYFGVRLFDHEPARISDRLVRRDDDGQYDFFEVSIDPNLDRRTAYQFRVSAAGVQRDVYLYDDTREDDAWDAVWQSAVHRDKDGWTAEIRIPLSQIRYNPSDSTQTWGINFSRRRLANNERSYFALESKVRHGKVSMFGKLTGLRLPRGGRRIELRPYVLTDTRTAPHTTGDPFFDGSSMGNSAGLDARYGLGTSYTLDMTFNPDFGQVEVDPAVINLSAFETFFPEKRPFFVEDAQVFDFSLSGRQNQLFYSRRIGREPRGSAPGGSDFSDIPAQTTILGAAKLTGRTPGGLSVGLLTALTREERGSAFDVESATRRQFVAEPRARFGVFRVQQDFRAGASQVGAIVTAMNRDLPGGGEFDFLTSNAYSVGIDFEHNWGGSRSRDWALFGFFASSYLKGSSEALIRIQRSSTHYFQRPDATRFSLDSTATSMTGVNWRLQFERRSAKHWTGGLWLGEVTPGFEINDLGFSRSGERIDVGSRISYQETKPGRLLRSYRINFFTFHNFRHEALDDVFSASSWKRAYARGAFSLSANVQFLNYWGLNVSSFYAPQSLSATATRGGPLMVDPASITYRVRANTDRRRGIVLGPDFEYRNRLRGGYRWRAGLRISGRPSSNVELSLEPNFTAEIDPAQYVTAFDDAGFTSTFGRRYLFADLKRNTLTLEARVNVAFTPHLTLQLFAQPLLSSGDYKRYKQLAAPEAFDFIPFPEGRFAASDGGSRGCRTGTTCASDGVRYIDLEGDGNSEASFSDRNFNIRSLRLNAVLRWEYRSGSTIFLVWQQSRNARENVGDFDLSRDLNALFGAPAENIFIVKVNYWLGI